MTKISVLITVFMFAFIVIAGCSGNPSAENRDITVIAEVHGEKITVQDIIDNPMIQGIVKQLIIEKMIKQEFKARQLPLDDKMVQMEWDTFVEMQGGDEATANEALKREGMDKKKFMDNMTIKVMLQQIIEQDKPITMEDARKDFEGNLEGNQRMYAQFVPDKREKPETITFEDVSEKVIENMRRRQFSQEVQNVIEKLNKEYEDNGWIKNYVAPEEPKGLTEIEKPAKMVEEVDPSQLRKAPIRKGKTEDEEEVKEHEEASDSSEGEESTEDESSEETEKEENTEKGNQEPAPEEGH